MSAKSWVRIDGSPYEAHREEYADFAEKSRDGRVNTEPWEWHFRKAALSEAGGATTDARGPQFGGAVQPQYLPMIAAATQPPVVASLLGSDTTSSNMVTLPKTDPENPSSAGVTAEGAAFGSVNVQVTPQNYRLRDHTSLLPITENFLADVSSAAAWMAKRHERLTLLAEQDDIINGDGSTGSLGFINAADSAETATAVTQGADAIAVALAKTIGGVFDASGLMPEWVLMNTTDWVAQLTERAATTGPFLSGGASLEALAPYGLRLALSSAVPSKTVIVGSVAVGTLWRHSSGIEVKSSNAYGTFFGAGLVQTRGRIRSTVQYDYPSGLGILSLT